jgi:hypothetical protein
MAHQSSIPPALAVLAGRRIDAANAVESRFPPDEAEHVARKLARHFRQERVNRLVCSAACGADILALEVAERLAIPATLVIPFASNIFRENSVTDRTGNWGERFDRLVTAARRRGDLVELGLDIKDEKAFTAANETIVQLASSPGHYRRLAFVVWEGKTRGSSDATADFLNRALSRGFEKRTVFTIRRRH